MMKLATFGPYVVSARAVPQGNCWEGVFSVHKYEGTQAIAASLVCEARSELAYPTQGDALEAAFLEGRASALARARDNGAMVA